MRFIESRLFAATSLLSLATQILLGSPATAATHPKYGGTLLEEWMDARKIKYPAAMEKPYKELGEICK